MIDIHCHIVPGVDDGASSLSESLMMAEMAADSGVTHIVATPHFRGELQSVQELSLLARQFTMLKQAVADAGLPLTLSCAAEVLCLPETVDLAAAHRLPTLDGDHYVLVEFFFDESLEFMNDTLMGLAAQGYTPVIAHPERYLAIQYDPDLALEWFQQGYILQLNKGSVLGAFGGRVRETARTLLADGIAHLIASDAHRSDFRTPHMDELTHWVYQHCDPVYAEILLERNPRRILEGRPVVPIE